MRYARPEILLSVSALRSIGSGTKGLILVESANPDSRPTNGAYEADE